MADLGGGLRFVVPITGSTVATSGRNANQLYIDSETNQLVAVITGSKYVVTLTPQ